MLSPSAAYHEAGHAITRLALGHSFDLVTIEPELASRLTGTTTDGVVLGRVSNITPWEIGIITGAGPIAEYLYYPDNILGSSVRELALARQLLGEKYISEITAFLRGDNLVGLAEALLQEGTLTYQEASLRLNIL